MICVAYVVDGKKQNDNHTLLCNPAKRFILCISHYTIWGPFGETSYMLHNYSSTLIL